MEAPVFNLAWVGGVVGFFLPLLVSLVKRSNWSVQVKRTVAILASVIAGVVTVGVQAGWEAADSAEFLKLAAFSVTQIYVVAGVTYANFWKDTAIEKSLESVGSPKAPRFDEGFNPGDPVKDKSLQ